MELIVALVLMDVIALALYSSMHTGFKAKSASQTLLKPYQSITPAMEFIRKDITSAVRPDGIIAGVFAGEDEAGELSLGADTLSFYTCSYLPDEDEISSNIINVEYALEDDIEREETVLKRLVKKNILSPTEVEPDEEVICRDVSGLNFRYFDGSGWVDEWDSSVESGQLPWAVEIILTIKDEESNRADESGLRDFKRIYMLPFSNEELSEESQTGSMSNV